jgi:Uncharacterized protein conserved in bacteria (DUF2325)
MCAADRTNASVEAHSLDNIVRAATRDSPALVASATKSAQCREQAVVLSYRRRRLWELDSHAHCPVVGVCLPLPVLRRLINKALGGQAVADDYELHCGAVADSKHRNKLSVAIQKELDRSHALALRQTQGVKTTEALAAWWQDHAAQHLAAALWATLTHPRCSSALEYQVLGYVHMVQHQVGAATRADQQQLDALLHENAVLASALAKAQARNAEQGQSNARKVEALNIELVRMRAELIGRDTMIAALEDARLQTEAAVPQLKSRLELARQLDMQIERTHQAERALMLAQQEAERWQERWQALQAVQMQVDTQPDGASADHPSLEVCSAPEQRLEDCTVLCVGGRASAVPVYRQLIEKMGGRFLHHDGGEEDNVGRLDHTLAAADLVICQTGCISHNAYWRVKSHCKRTGKECMYVDNPSAHSLFKGLTQVRMHWHKA